MIVDAYWWGAYLSSPGVDADGDVVAPAMQKGKRWVDGERAIKMTFFTNWEFFKKVFTFF